jgi:hypothetical protein
MGYKDLYTHLAAAIAIPAATYAADNTPAAVDLRDYTSAMLELAIGVGGITFDGTNKVEFKLTHSDDDSTYTAVADDDVHSATAVGTGGIIASLIAAHATATVTRVGYKGGKRYVKLLADFSGTHGTGTPISAVWTLGGKYIQPVTLPAA